MNIKFKFESTIFWKKTKIATLANKGASEASQFISRAGENFVMLFHRLVGQLSGNLLICTIDDSIRTTNQDVGLRCYSGNKQCTS
jgi:hypothetical protein